MMNPPGANQNTRRQHPSARERRILCRREMCSTGIPVIVYPSALPAASVPVGRTWAVPCYHQGMANGNLLDREEYIEQVYFFRVFRDRVATNLAAQEILEHIHEEILSTTRLPMAIQFLATEIKHTGLLSSGFSRLGHYFTPFQTFVIRQTEKEGVRFSVETALLVLEREAQYRADQATRPGLFVYQFEVLSRNRLGYDEGLAAM